MVQVLENNLLLDSMKMMILILTGWLQENLEKIVKEGSYLLFFIYHKIFIYLYTSYYNNHQFMK